MCGIVGFIDFNKKSSPEILQSCSSVLKHRGPDGQGSEFFNEENFQLGLGHQRLSIIDLTKAASQPMWYKHWCIVFNGEMYNFAEIKTELQALGHIFHSHSDTEVLLHAWEEWGSKMIHRFIGMFAFVIYNSRDKSIVCFRDRAGIKPFYYYWKNGIFLFGSELKSFHQHPAFQKEINHQALHQYLQYGYILAPNSIFQHTYKMLPGHFLTFHTGERKYELTKYWDVYEHYNKPKLDISEEEATQEMERLLISACNYRMIADVPVGVFLSGGYDSSAVTALVQAGRTARVKTYTIGFHESDHNEAGYAKKVAQHIGTDHTEYFCTAKEAQEIIPTISYFCDEPFGDSSIIPTVLVSQLARKEVTVALSADGGDETFAGYSKYPLALDLYRKLNYIPSFLQKPAGRILNMVPGSLLTRLSGSTAAPLKKERFSKALRERNLTVTGIMDEFLSQVYSDRQLKDLLSFSDGKGRSFFDSAPLLNSSLTDLDKMLALDYKTYMVDDILVKVDRAGMSTSLESREPLVDYRLIEFAARLPSHLKMRGNNQKVILKNVVHRYVPKELLERPKMGFGVPVAEWLRTDLRFYCDEFINDAELAKHGLFQKQAIDHIKQRFFEGDRNYSALFWYLLMFQMWYKRWMD